MLVSIAGSLAKNLINKVVVANTNIDTDYTAPSFQKSTLMVMTNTTGVLSLIADVVSGSLNSGTSLNSNQWYSFEVPLMSGSVYNLQFSAGATMQVKWLGGV